MSPRPSSSNFRKIAVWVSSGSCHMVGCASFLAPNNARGSAARALPRCSSAGNGAGGGLRTRR
eukprot:6249656-Pyramimonas_sp.AAC.1